MRNENWVYRLMGKLEDHLSKKGIKITYTLWQERTMYDNIFYCYQCLKDKRGIVIIVKYRKQENDFRIYKAQYN